MGRWLCRLLRGRRLVAASASDKGPFRAENQDSMLADVSGGFFVVADGIGGGNCGGTASKIVVDRVREASRKAKGIAVPGRIELLAATLTEANAAIRDFAKEKDFRQIGTTAVALTIDPGQPTVAAYCNAGDSRLYRIRGGFAEQLTHDHTVAAELESVTGLAARDTDGKRRPLAHVLTRALGTKNTLQLEWGQTAIEPGDRFLLCSDGLHGVVTDIEIGRLASMGDVEAAVKALMALVYGRGAPDNYTIVMTEVRAG